MQLTKRQELERQIDDAIARIDAKSGVDLPDPAAEPEVPDDDERS